MGKGKDVVNDFKLKIFVFCWEQQANMFSF